MNINESNQVMTVFYSKISGEVKAIGTGEQDFNVFGDNEEDFKIIYDKIIIKKDEYALKNTHLFIWDKIAKKLILKDSSALQKYV